MSGILSVVGTPIGNLDDLSPRARRILSEADLIACEDTRVARTLLARAVPDGVRARLIAYHAHTERGRTADLVHQIAAGARVALTTDAGMPGLSDPGQHLVAACREAGLRVEVIPGPSAVVTALIASGLPMGRFAFEGFLPRTAAARRRRLEVLAREERTIVVFEAPHRLEACLTQMAEVLGPRRGAIARELTKLHEEVVRGTMQELLEHVRAVPPRGEITVVIEGAVPVVEEMDPKSLARAVAALVGAGIPKRDAIAQTAAAHRVPKKVVYQAVLDHGR